MHVLFINSFVHVELCTSVYGSYTFKEQHYMCLDPCGSQLKLIVLHRHLSAMSICLNEPGDLHAIDLCSRANGWQSCPKNKAFSGVPFLTFNAAATICMVLYTFCRTKSPYLCIEMLQIHDTCFYLFIVSSPYSVQFTLITYPQAPCIFKFVSSPLLSL